jgi:hypothetical protein
MAHFAKVENNKVTQVIVADQAHVDAQEGTWVKVSYNMYGGVYYDASTNTPATDQSVITGNAARERKNFPAVGWLYDGTGFYPPQPFVSWSFNSSTYLWDAPVTKPSDDSTLDDDGNVIQYVWSEEAYNLDKSDPKTDGWVKIVVES